MEISKILFNPNYDAKPLSENIYELIHRFIKANDSKNAANLHAFLKKELNYEFCDHTILNRIGYHRLEKEEKSSWALELFKLNVQFFPEDGNLWDSLGEAYLKYDQKGEAIKSYSKAVKLGSEGSIKVLDKLLKKD